MSKFRYWNEADIQSWKQHGYKVTACQFPYLWKLFNAHILIAWLSCMTNRTPRRCTPVGTLEHIDDLLMHIVKIV